MEIRLGLLADAATKSGGKLNLLGVFDRISASSFPVQHRRLALILRLEFHASEAGQTKEIEIVFMNADGKSLTGRKGQFVVGDLSDFAGEIRVQDDQIIEIENLPLPSAGNYEFQILVGGEPRFTIPLRADKIKAVRKKRGKKK